MRLKIDPFYVSEHCDGKIFQIDQLTLVRNYVRAQLQSHRESVDGDCPTEVSLEVAWQNGDIEELTFTDSVGFPISPERDWYGDWLKELQV